MDHRWPSINNHGDYAYSAMDAGGLWQVFVDDQQVTSGQYNKMFPVIADNKDVVYFQDGGSGGVGWQVIRHNNGDGESQIEFSSRDVASGAHRDAGRYAGIAATDGTVIWTYDFYDRFGVHTTRFNVSGVGRLAPDFYPYNHPDIDAGRDIVYAGFGGVYKATVSSPVSATFVAQGAMGRINDTGDIVTVTGNLDAPGTVTIYAAPDYTQSTVVGNGSWADINNAGNVVIEAPDPQGHRQLYLYTPQPDLTGQSFHYQVLDGQIPQEQDGPLPFNAHFSIAAQIINSGMGNASAFAVRFYASQDSIIETTDQLLAEVRLDALPAGGTQAATVGSLMLPQNLNWTGRIYVGMIIDPDQMLPETEASVANNSNRGLAVDHAMVQLYDPIMSTRVVPGFANQLSAVLYLFRNGFHPVPTKIGPIPTGGGWSKWLPVSARITSRYDGVTRSGFAYRQQAFIRSDASHTAWWIVWQGDLLVSEPNPETALFYDLLNPGWFTYVQDWHRRF